jgi:hypothetical protein
MPNLNPDHSELMPNLKISELMPNLNPDLKHSELMPNPNPDLKHSELMFKLNLKHFEI